MACRKALTDELAGEAKTREANDTVLGTASAEPVQVPCTNCQKLMPAPPTPKGGPLGSTVPYCSAECEYPPCAGPQCSQKRPVSIEM